jgi:hypothetical protein
VLICLFPCAGGKSTCLAVLGNYLIRNEDQKVIIAVPNVILKAVMLDACFSFLAPNSEDIIDKEKTGLFVVLHNDLKELE